MNLPDLHLQDQAANLIPRERPAGYWPKPRRRPDHGEGNGP